LNSHLLRIERADIMLIVALSQPTCRSKIGIKYSF
jgi:hypothetical protein